MRIHGRLIEPALRRVTGPDGAATIEPKLLLVLLCLARVPGRVVSKEELLGEVWNGTYVTEDVLTRAIGELRKLFGDSATAPRVIETIRKSGYRLIADVSPAPAPLRGPGESSAGASTSAAAGRRRPPARVVALAAGAAVAALALVVAARLGLVGHRSIARSAPIRVRPLTGAPGNERDPAVSPDGTRVAFAWNGGDGQDFSLYVQLLAGGTPLRLTKDEAAEDRAPAWSPDGQRLAFTRATDSRCDIFLVGALGGGQQRLAPCADKDYRRLAWSPDGRWLAFSGRNASSQLRLELLSVQTGDRRVLTNPPAGILGDTSPAFSPDGRTIAFARNVSDGVGDIYSVAAAGGEPRRLTFDNRDLMGLDWLRGGRELVFSSSRAGIYNLWKMPASGGEPTWFAGAGTKMKHPFAARSADVVAFENWTYDVNLWRLPLGKEAAAASNGRRITRTSDQWNFQPQISPDGTRVAFVSTRSGEEEIWVGGAGGEAAMAVTSFTGARLETPRWSPDGRRLVFSARLDGRADLFWVDAAGATRAQRLTSGETDSLAPSWSRDGTSIYFASRRGGPWRIWSVALADHAVRPVTAQDGYASRESVDGRWLFFTRSDRAGIWRQPVAGGAAERITGSLAPEDWANWEVAADGIYFREICGQHLEPALVFLSFDDRSTRHVALLPDQGWPGFSVAPDRSWIVYPRVDRHSCEIRVVENFS